MQLKENTPVLTFVGEKVGDIKQVVLDPKTYEVTHVVIRQGFLLTEDKVMPTDLIDVANEDQVILKQGAKEQLESLPRFEKTEHIPIEDMDHLVVPLVPASGMPAFFWYNARGNNWPYPLPDYVDRTHQQIPDGTVPLEAGTKVTSAEGKHVGNVEEVITDPDIDRATHILISQGLLFQEKKLIPTNWINTVSDDEIRLCVNADVLEKVPAAS